MPWPRILSEPKTRHQPDDQTADYRCQHHNRPARGINDQRRTDRNALKPEQIGHQRDQMQQQPRGNRPAGSGDERHRGEHQHALVGAVVGQTRSMGRNARWTRSFGIGHNGPLGWLWAQLCRITIYIKDACVTDEIKEEDYAALAGFRYELRRFLRFSEQAAHDAGLTPQQHQALLAIRAAGAAGMLIGDLAERLFLKPNSTSELVKRLAEHNLVERRHGSVDGREVRITLTEHAGDILASLSASHRAELRRLRPLLEGLLDVL